MDDKQYKETIKYPEGKYRSVVIDTINSLQNNLYNKLLKDKGKAAYDDWKDFGVEIFELYRQLKVLEDAVLVQVLGYEGTGKTVGVSGLNPDETCILNADQKPLSFFGGRGQYPIDNSKKNYKEVTTYEATLAAVRAIHDKRKGTFFIFVLGHIEDFKSADNASQTRQRLKILGKQATKLGIEGLNFTHTYYTKIDPTMSMDDANRYKLVTSNSGFNTARSPQGYWEGSEIPNNYQLIVNRTLEDYGEMVKIV